MHSFAHYIMPAMKAGCEYHTHGASGTGQSEVMHGTWFGFRERAFNSADKERSRSGRAWSNGTNAIITGDAKVEWGRLRCQASHLGNHVFELLVGWRNSCSSMEKTLR